MKSTVTLREDRWTMPRTLNPYISEALQRKRHQADYQTEMELVGAYLRALRMERGYTLDAVAKALKMPKGRLYKIERGTYPHFNVPYLYSLADHYDTSVAGILSAIPAARFDNVDC